MESFSFGFIFCTSKRKLRTTLLLMKCTNENIEMKYTRQNNTIAMEHLIKRSKESVNKVITLPAASCSNDMVKISFKRLLSLGLNSLIPSN